MKFYCYTVIENESSHNIVGMLFEIPSMNYWYVGMNNQSILIEKL